MKNDTVHFRVLLKNGDIPDIVQIAQNFDWAKDLMWMDMECFLIDENGYVYLSDEMGSFVWADQDMFRVEFPIEEMLRAELADRDETIYKLKEENEQLIRSFCEYETICADGEVGASVANMKKRIDKLEIELADRDDTIKKLNEKLHDEMVKLEIAAAGNKRLIIALKEIYNNGEKHNVNWCKRMAMEGLGLK